MTNFFPQQHKKKLAFSLLELSIVVVIIGMLVAGVMQGTNMIRASRLASAKSATSQAVVPKLNGLVAWYETSRLDSLKSGEAFDGANPTEWYDISPSSIVMKKNKLTKTAGSNVVFVSEGINKFSSLKFSGSGKFSLTNFYQGTSQQNTIFLVIKPLSIQNPSIIIDSSDTSNASSVGIKTNAVNFNDGTSTDTSTGSNAANFIVNGEYIVVAYFNGSSSKAYVNNALTEAGAGVINNGHNAIKGLVIGANRNGSSGFNGLISEVIVFNRPLQSQERKDVMSYLSKKYKITVFGI
jgi:prepilin-type N-terminal cleavage/methylation domain-containing protein